MRALALYAFLGGAIALPVVSQDLPIAGQWLDRLMEPRIEDGSRYDAAENRLTQILALRDEEWQHDSGAEYRLREDRSKRLNRHLESALAVLADGEATALRRQLTAVAADLQLWQGKLDEYRAESSAAATAPTEVARCADDGRSVMVSLVCTVVPDERTSLQKQVDEAQEKIGELGAAKARLTAELAASLQEMGIPLSPDDVGGLINLVTGERILEAHAVHRSLSEINAALVRAVEAGQGTLEVVKRYYGLHVVLVELGLHFHESFIDEIHGLWLPRLERIRASAEEAQQSARDMLASEADAHLRKRLIDNVEANDLSIRAVDLYADHLNSQANDVASRWEQMRRRHKVALNTYRTLTVQSDVVTVMKQASSSLEELMLLDLPPLHLFESRELQETVERLKGRLLASSE